MTLDGHWKGFADLVQANLQEDSMNWLSHEDRSRIEGQAFEADSEPSFEVLKACLVWPDECPEGISNEGREVLADLWIVRGFLHRGIPRERWGLDPDHFEKVWETARSSGLGWNGFRRLILSKADADYLSESIGEDP